MTLLRKNIALVLIDVSDISGSGGAQRFFSDFFDDYNSYKNTRFKLFYFTDYDSYKVLSALGKLNFPKQIIYVHNISNRFKNIIEPLEFVIKIILNNIKVIHLTMYGPQYYNRLRFLNKLPSFIRPKIVVNIVDCKIAYTYLDKEADKNIGNYEKYSTLFNTVKIDGVYTWYKFFKEFAEKNRIIKSDPFIGTADSRYTDYSRFKPSDDKINVIVYAARLDDQKNPLFFVEAVNILRLSIPEKIQGWQFFMYGKGPLEVEVKKRIREYGLEKIITLGSQMDLSEVFARSKCFVSTQDYENFPSLSMNEAMAAGNTIISRNVGQTDYFVKDGINGILLKEDSPKALADALKNYIEHPERHENMQKESIRLTKEVHTSENFIKDIDKFWSEIISPEQKRV
jgi:glycosyltransferase involved in cell wall biosynthesis